MHAVVTEHLVLLSSFLMVLQEKNGFFSPSNAFISVKCPRNRVLLK
jgi:hypothetical protein